MCIIAIRIADRLIVSSMTSSDRMDCNNVSQTGGLSNKQKQHKKRMPLAATRAKAARSRQEKKQQRKRSGNQFRGRKAWK